MRVLEDEFSSRIVRLQQRRCTVSEMHVLLAADTYDLLVGLTIMSR